MSGFLEVAELDLERFAEAGAEPRHVFDRPNGGGTWLAASGPLNADRVTWTEDRSSPHIVVPTARYLVPPVPEALFAFGVEIALRAMTRLKRPVTRAVLVLGRPVEDLRPEQDAFAVRFGLALCVRE